MAVQWLRFSLRGYGGAEPTGTQFFDLLSVNPADGFELSPSDSLWKSANIDLLMVDIESCRTGPESHNEFASRINAGLKRVAEWLSARPMGAFETWRSMGKVADMFIGGWLDGEQFDLCLPPEFLLACGRAGLPIDICTND
jgi:hypothetical protein